MKTTIAALLLACMPLAASPVLAGEPMDRSLDRPVTRAANATPAPRPNATDTKLDPVGVFVATCRDGRKYYHVTGERRGACSGAGGVEVFADGTVPKSRGTRRSSLQ